MIPNKPIRPMPAPMPSKDGTPISHLFDKGDARSNFDFKKALRKTYIKDMTKFGDRAHKMSKQDTENLKSLTTDNSKISVGGKVSRGWLKKAIDLELNPAIKNMVDPKTKKYLDPFNYKDRLRLQDLKEYKKDIQGMIKKKK